MNLHEYQAKEILKQYGIPTPSFGVVSHPKEAARLAKELGLQEAVLKIQVHAGGRGKAGGVRFAKFPDEIEKVAKELIGMRMVNQQTGPQGVIAHQLLLSSPVDIRREFYLGATIDRENARPILIFSREGGMDIEEVAARSPEKMLTLPITLQGKVKPYHLLRAVNFFGWKGDMAKVGMQIIEGVAKALIKLDASLLEINPLVEDTQDKLWALDAKLSLDDNALFRHPQMQSLYDPTQYSKNETAAKEYDLAYIALEGDIGCLVNGAGLAMATMDVIRHYGGSPANFLDVGGGASREKIAAAFKIILADPKVKAIFINIFGGIMNCATLAEGILSAAKEVSISVPLFVRMEGTNVLEGKKMLQKAGVKITTADSLGEAAKQAVDYVRGM